MSKRGWDGDGATQPGVPKSNDFSGFTSDGSTNSVGSIAGRKILNPKRLKGARPQPVKPLPPQAQAQPVSGNTQNFGFTFGGGAAPAPASGGFGFGSQSSSVPQQSSGFSFGSQQASEPQQQQQSSFGFNFAPTGPTNFQSNTPSFGSNTQSPGFQGSIFNIQPSSQPAPAANTSTFGSFNSNNQNSNETSNNMFGNPQANASKAPFGFPPSTNQPEQSKPLFSFGQSNTASPGFGSGTQSTSAPSSFNFNNDNSMSEGQANPTTSSFTFGSNTQAESVALEPSATKAPLFSFNSTQQTGQNMFSMKPQADSEPKPSLFSFSTSSAATNPSATATSFAPKSSLFGTTAETKPSGANMFDSGAIQASDPSTTATQSANFPIGSSIGNTGMLAVTPSSMAAAKNGVNLFGASNDKSQDIAKNDQDGQANQQATNKAPLFNIQQNTTSTTQNSESSNETKTTSSKPMFNFQPLSAQNNQNSELPKVNIFGAPPAQTSTSPTKIEQKSLPSFSFDNKAPSLQSSTKLAGESTSKTGVSTGDGLFKTSSSNMFSVQPGNDQAKSIFPQTERDTSKPLFTFKSTQSTSEGGTAKPLFGLPADNSSTRTGPENAVNPKPTLFNPNPSLSTSEDFQSDKAASKSLFNVQPSSQEQSKLSPAKPSFNFQPTTQANSQSPTKTTTSSASASTSTVETPAKPAFGFKPSTELHQDISPNKSPFNFRPAAQKPQANGTSSTSPRKAELGVSKPIEPIPDSPTEEVKEFGLERPPKDQDLPESFAAKWSTLRTDDLPTDEAVDILLHDWILQLEIPEVAFTGMDMNQRDDLTWLWQQNAIDAAWDYHVRELGNNDRNLLEVFRIVLTLKDAVDRFHQKTWSRSDSLVNPKIFDERHIRKMAKRNIEIWENGLKSEIKNLKKRKANTQDDSVASDVDGAKRSKVGETGKAVASQSLFPAMSKSSSESYKSPFVEDDISSNGPQNPHNAFGGQKSSTKQSSGIAKSSGQQGDFTASKTAPLSSFTQQDKSNKSGPATNPPSASSPIKTSIFANTKDNASEATPSPQRSKTSQLFASIANKPAESPAPSTKIESSGKSLFDRITRDSSGAPVRDESEPALFVPDNAQEEEGEEEDNEQEGEDDERGKDDGDYEDEEDDESEDDDEEEEGEEEKVTPAPKRTNLFAQSTSAGAEAKEAALGSVGDHTWKPDSPIRFSKTAEDVSSTTASDKPITGFVPAGGMPKASTSATSDMSVSSQNSWQAPANPFGFFKQDKKEPEKEKAPSPPKFEMPKPPTTTSGTGFTVSSQSTWQAPSNPFGLFKSKPTDSAVAPTVTLTAPSPQRPARQDAAKPLFDLGAPPSKPEAPKSLFGFVPKTTSDTGSDKDTTPQPSIFSSSGSAAPTKSIFGSVDAAPVAKKPLFEFTKSDASSAPAAPVSNPWLDFAKGINKSSSPAPSGASVFASLNTSLNPSRASSPAMSAVSTAAGDTENEHNDEDEAPKEAQLDLGSANAGEENEDLLQSIRSKAYELYGKGEEKKEWTVRGVGELRVLKNKETNKVRAVLRADQSAKVLLNAGLISAANYSLMGPKRVNFTVASPQGVPARWFIQVGKEEDAKKLSQTFEENKGN